jgi:hypothetical protein
MQNVYPCTQALHTAVLGAAHTCIHDVAKLGLPMPPPVPEPPCSPGPKTADLEALAASAWEASIAEQPERAAAFLARRCLDADNCQVGYAASCSLLALQCAMFGLCVTAGASRCGQACM